MQSTQKTQPSRHAQHVLIVDDDESILTVLRMALDREGYHVSTANNEASATSLMMRGGIDAVITDVTMPGTNGLSALKHWRSLGHTMPVFVMSAHHVLLHASKAAELGATQFLAKPFELEALTSALAHALGDHRAPLAPQDHGVLKLADNTVLIGKSAAMQEIYRQMLGVISNDVTVMISGESGTGKELIARALHLLGTRKHKPFIALNMAAIPVDLVESALFGHEKGAFTGAYQRQSGAFEQAEGGTLFLDEIGDMPLHAQTRLLRVLQEGTYAPIGSVRHRSSNVRIITATHRNLQQAIAQASFREDLFYRLHVVPLAMPPLRLRAEDIPYLAEHFLQAAHAQNMPLKHLSTSATLALMQHRWPGNVRELKHLILRLVTSTPRPEIRAEDVHDLLVPEARAKRETTESLKPVLADNALPTAALQSLEQKVQHELERLIAQLPPHVDLYDVLMPCFERPLIQLALNESGGSQVKAAKRLGINRNTLRSKLAQLKSEKSSS